jgi:hypothetical protein
MTQITLTYYRTAPPEKATGVKHVLWEITTDKGAKVYDWGFSEWNGSEWSAVDVPEGYTATVFAWAHTVNPSYVTSPLMHIN